MNRKTSMEIICQEIKNEIIISANGFLSRDLFNTFEKPSNFYMLGSMGLASSIGLGIAIKNPKKKIFVFDGDGNILMNLGSLTTIGNLKPKNLIHIVFDNNSHESTGGQPTTTNKIQLDKIAQVVNYKIFKVENELQLSSIMKRIKKMVGPIMILIKIKKNKKIGGRITIEPVNIKKRFVKSI
ncbi:thiamine pyrophosphate-dependent enzyme [Nitrosopumilus sp.]|nr:thiamine pyrophosphate-dependent enzyme [Nitrosopumilus sp.]MDB4840793.1 thiamine pyrophosphate-dependent enzyme [Nitrosopumilus sp.]|tara:strand:- start:4673 stop:5221 length:549 start_codon:yes stop_codon:yes gene_type:complete